MKMYFLFHSANTAWLMLILALSISARAKIHEQIIPAEHLINLIVLIQVAVWKRNAKSRLSGHDHEDTIIIPTHLWRSLVHFPPEHKPVLCSHKCTDLTKPKEDTLDEVETATGLTNSTTTSEFRSQMTLPALAYVDSGQGAQLSCYFDTLGGVKKI